MAASLGNATVNVLARTVLFEQSLRRSLKRMSALTAAVFAGVGAANFFGSALKESIALEKQLQKIQTFLTDQPDAIKKAFDAAAVRGLSNELGISAIEISEALYYMIGSGVDAADAMDAVRAAASSAVATVSDLGLVANFTSSGINAFAGTVDTLTGKMVDAQHINDLFFAALKEGKGTANDLAKYLSTAIPSAKGLGIGLGEVVSAASAATLTGKSARKVMTGLDYVMSGLGNSSKGVGEAFKEITGKTFPDFVKGGGKLQDAIKILGSEIGIQQLNNVKGATTGIRAIQELLVVWEDYTRIQENVKSAEGAAIEGRDIMNKSISRQIDFLKTKFTNFRGSVGDWLGPVLFDAAKKVQEVYPRIREAFLGIVGIIGQAFSQIGAVIGPVIGQIQEAFAKINLGEIVTIIQAVVTGILAGLAPLFAAIYALIGLFAAVAQYISPVITLFANMTPIIVGITAAFVAYKTVLFLTMVITKTYVALQKLQAIWTAAVTAAQILQIGATSGLAGAWTALTLIMSANPIGLAIAALVGLVAMLVFAWKKSETFRKVVAAAFNGIKDTIVTAVQIIVGLATYWAEAYLRGFKAILDGLAHLPDWLGGGKFADASAAVGRLINGVEAIRNKVNNLADAARAADWEIQKLGQNLKTLKDEAGRTSMDRLSLLRAGVDPDTTTAINAGELNFDNSTNPYGGGGADFSGGGYDPLGGKDDAGKKAISEAAKKIKAALKRAFADLDRIAKNTSKQSVDTLKENFRQLYADLGEANRKDIVAYAKKQEAALIKAATKQSKVLKGVLKKYKADTLVEMAIARDKVLDKLDGAKDKLKELVAESNDFKKSIRETVLGLGNVSQESDGIGVTFTGIRNRMRKAVEETKRFNAAIKTLQKLKLNPELIRQLVEAGPEALDQAATIAASGKKGVDQLNTLQGALLTQSKALEKTAYDQFFKNGVAVAQGLVAGLEKERDSILKAMDKIADQLVDRIKKKLNIKSPSRVFGEIGENITAGLAHGIEAKGPAASKAAANVSQQIHFGPGSVAVSGVGDTAAQRAGILTGQGIVQVLRERQIAAMLTGVQ